MTGRLACRHCGKPLFAMGPGKLATFGAVSIWLGKGPDKAVVECPGCGKDTPLPLGILGVSLPDPSSWSPAEPAESQTIH